MNEKEAQVNQQGEITTTKNVRLHVQTPDRFNQ